MASEELKKARVAIEVMTRWMERFYPKHLLIEREQATNPGQVLVHQMWSALEDYWKVRG